MTSRTWWGGAVGSLMLVAVVGCGSGGPNPAELAGRDFDDFDDLDLDGDLDGDDFGDAVRGALGDGGLGDSDAPITYTVDGVTWGASDGSCQVDDEVVSASGGAGFAVSAVNVRWFKGEEHLPYVRRLGATSVEVASDDGPAPFSLRADSSSPGTSWDVRVSGTTAEVSARMVSHHYGFEGPDHMPEGQFHDVTIRVRCDQASWGMATPSPREDPFVDVYWDGPERPSGEIAVSVDGETHAVTYLDTCRIGQGSVDASGLSDDAEIYIPHHTGDGLAFAPGDPRGHRGNFGEAETYIRQTTLEFERDGNTVSWTGMLIAPDGSEVEATVTVRCDGETARPLGTAALEVGGETFRFEYPSMCDISGSTIEFQGREGYDTWQDPEASTLVVWADGSSGGHLIQIVTWEDGQPNQSSLSDQAVQIAGPRATWTGELQVRGEDVPAAITIECN